MDPFKGRRKGALRGRTLSCQERGTLAEPFFLLRGRMLRLASGPLLRSEDRRCQYSSLQLRSPDFDTVDDI